MLCDCRLRLADDVFQVFRHLLRRLAQHLTHLAHILAGLRFVDFRRSALVSFRRSEIPERKRDVRRRLFGPVIQQIDDVAGGGAIQFFESPAGSGDNAARDPDPIDLRATGALRAAIYAAGSSSPSGV